MVPRRAEKGGGSNARSHHAKRRCPQKSTRTSSSSPVGQRGVSAAIGIVDDARLEGAETVSFAVTADGTAIGQVRYRELLRVEDLFRRAKAQLRTRPIYHSCDAAIRGHVFCSFLALVLQKELADRCRAAGVDVEWDDLIRDLDRLQEASIENDGKRVTTRTHVQGQVGKVFQAAGVALPPNWREHTA